MSSMNFTCDSCGREVFGCTFVNGMKFCARCYQETFGETDKDRKIADLEAKLAESEKKAYSRGHSQRDIANEMKLNALREDVANKEKRIVKLKKQLAEKEKEISEVLAKQSITCLNTIEKAYQDKISFAVEQLEKVLVLIHNAVNIGRPEYDLVGLYDAVSNQIKQLKGEVYE